MENYGPYLEKVKDLQGRNPRLKTIVNYFNNRVRESDYPLLQDACHRERIPIGRTCVLEFRDSRVDAIPLSLHDLQIYAKDPYLFQRYRDEARCMHRLFLVEDLTPEYIEELGTILSPDPTAFADQLNTWHYNANPSSAPMRNLPSLTNSMNAFSLRYYEIRSRCKNLGFLRRTASFVSRKFEPWAEIQTRIHTKSSDLALVRRNTTFWSRKTERGWDGEALLITPYLARSGHSYLYAKPAYPLPSSRNLNANEIA